MRIRSPQNCHRPGNLVLKFNKKWFYTFTPRRHNASSHHKGLHPGRHPPAPCCSWGKSEKNLVSKAHVAESGASNYTVHWNIWGKYNIHQLQKQPLYVISGVITISTWMSGASGGGNIFSGWWPRSPLPMGAIILHMIMIMLMSIRILLSLFKC